jgi:hypothetical protein
MRHRQLTRGDFDSPRSAAPIAASTMAVLAAAPIAQDRAELWHGRLLLGRDPPARVAVDRHPAGA